MRALLDVNVLIALLDSAHIHHSHATNWLSANIAGGWASLLDAQCFDWHHPFNARQLTDAYLLAIAVQCSGVFVTFDHAVPLRAVVGAGIEHLILI